MGVNDKTLFGVFTTGLAVLSLLTADKFWNELDLDDIDVCSAKSLGEVSTALFN